MSLAERCKKIWKEEFNISDDKINWLLKQLNPKANNDVITDDQIRIGKNRLLFYGLSEAIMNYVAWEKKQW
jgi:hypothetical protein